METVLVFWAPLFFLSISFLLLIKSVLMSWTQGLCTHYYSMKSFPSLSLCQISSTDTHRCKIWEHSPRGENEMNCRSRGHPIWAVSSSFVQLERDCIPGKGEHSVKNATWAFKDRTLCQILSRFHPAVHSHFMIYWPQFMQQLFWEIVERGNLFLDGKYIL